MDKQEPGDSFYHKAKSMPGSASSSESLIPPTDSQLNELAHRLAWADFSTESQIREKLRKQLAERSSNDAGKQRIRFLDPFKLSHFPGFFAWVGFSLAFIVIVGWLTGFFEPRSLGMKATLNSPFMTAIASTTSLNSVTFTTTTRAQTQSPRWTATPVLPAIRVKPDSAFPPAPVAIPVPNSN